MRVRIDLAYDGSSFSGFAWQPDRSTVQGVLEAALHRLCGVAVVTTCAGRTDAGVHASAQVVSCDVPDTGRVADDPAAARRALDALCGPQIAILRVRQAHRAFDARAGATQRRYRYRLCDAEAMYPLWRHDTWHVGPPALDVPGMDEGGRHLQGEHDFSSFCRRRDDQHLVRRIDRVNVRRRPGGLVVVSVDGKAFCHQMVRSVTGCLLTVGRGTRSPAAVADVLAAGDRAAAGQVAPPHGLTLVNVSYTLAASTRPA